MFSHLCCNPLAYGVIVGGVLCILNHANGLASASHRPVAQALARLVTLVPTYLHELGHASMSIAITGRARIRLYSVKTTSDRDDGLVSLGATDAFFRGPLTNFLVSAGPALTLWPAAVLAAFCGVGGGAASEAVLVGVLLAAGSLSVSDMANAKSAIRVRFTASV